MRYDDDYHNDRADGNDDDDDDVDDYIHLAVYAFNLHP